MALSVISWYYSSSDSSCHGTVASLDHDSKSEPSVSGMSTHDSEAERYVESMNEYSTQVSYMLNQLLHDLNCIFRLGMAL